MSSNISCKVNLAHLKNATVIKSGKNKDVDCLLIPINQNHLVVGTKGVYIDLSLIPRKTKTEGIDDTHLVKQSLPKEVYTAMTEEERKATPIIGNAREWTGNSGIDTPNEVPTIEDDGDLPF